MTASTVALGACAVTSAAAAASFSGLRAHITTVSDALYPHADALLALGAAAFKSGDALAPESLVPAYLRQKVAEIPGKTST